MDPEQARQAIEALYFEQIRTVEAPRKERERFERIHALAAEAGLDEWTTFARGAILRKEEDHEGALRCFEEAIEIRPDFPMAWNGKGIVLCNLGRYEEALDAYEKALQLDPEFAYAWNGKGNALRGLGRHEEALGAFEKALQLDPEFAYAWQGMGRALHGQGRHEEALDAYKKSIRLNPGWYGAHFNIGLLYLRQNEFENARKSFERAIELDLPDEWRDRVELHLKRITAELEAQEKAAGSPAQEEEREKASEAGLGGELYESLEKRGLLDRVATQRKEFEETLEEALGAPRKVTAGGVYDDTLFVLRDWNSFTPILPDRFRNPEISTFDRRLGGGYFLTWRGYGVVIDPGVDFVTQLYKRGLSIADVDAVVVTHCHLDHTRDVEALVDLNYRFNERQGHKTDSQNFRELQFLLCPSARTKFGEYLKQSGACKAPREIQGGDTAWLVSEAIALSPQKVFHRDITSEDEAIGLVFELTREDGGKMRVGFTSDSRWEDSLAAAFSGCDVLVAHLGTMETQKEFLGDGLSNHLGLKGCHQLLRRVKPRLLILGEFGEELVSVRLEIIRVMNEQKREETQRVLAGDANLAVKLGGELMVQCSDPKCWPRGRFISLDTVKPHMERDGLFRYHCDDHFLGGHSG